MNFVSHHVYRLLSRLAGLLGLAFCGWLILLASQILAYSTVSYASGDAAVVLGAAVWRERPSPVFRERIDHAINLYNAGSVEAIIFTGGIGLGDDAAEAEIARRYAIAQGVPAEAIYLEERSTVTYENLAQAKQIIDAQGFSQVLIVSDPLHLKRAVTMARDLGIEAAPAPTPTSRYRTWRSKLPFLLKESYFYAGYLIQRRFSPVYAGLMSGLDPY